MSVQLGYLRIVIVHGDLTKEQTGAILNSSNKALDLTKGMLPAHILTLATSPSKLRTGKCSLCFNIRQSSCEADKLFRHFNQVYCEVLKKRSQKPYLIKKINYVICRMPFSLHRE